MWLFALLATAIAAPGASSPVSGPAASAPASAHLATGVEIALETTDLISSRRNRPGDTFHMRVTQSVNSGGALLIPAGTDAYGEVVDAAPGGFGGRPGKLILAARYIDLQGKRIPLRHFYFGESGQDRTTAALAVGIAVGLPSLLVSGGNIDVPAGTRVTARLAQDEDLAPVAPDGPPRSTDTSESETSK